MSFFVILQMKAALLSLAAVVITASPETVKMAEGLPGLKA